MMNIPNIERPAHDIIINTVRLNLDRYRGSDDNWLLDFWASRGYELPSGSLEVDRVKLDVDLANPCNDADNAIRLYKGLKISPAIASSGMFWTIYSHDMLGYLKKRWPLTGNDDDDEKMIRSKYVYDWEAGKRELGRGGLSSLWWSVHLTIDYARADAYELTREAMVQSDVISQIRDRSSTLMNREVTKAVLEYSLRRRKEGNPLSRAEFRALTTYLNALGKSIRIDAMGGEEFRRTIEAFFVWYNKRPS